jgi:transmembrane 9 superfamily protein 2/4
MGAIGAIGALKAASVVLPTVLAILALATVPATRAFYLPGVAPADFAVGDPVNLKVNKLASPKNLPYDFYSLYSFCKPETVHNFHENLGEVLRGDRIENSVFTGTFRKDSHCVVACSSGKLTEKDANLIKDRIGDEYKVNMILDNLPVGQVRMKKVKEKDPDTGKTREVVASYYERGFPVGKDGAIYNHLVFKVLYHEDEVTQTSRIVGFEVEPYSVESSLDDSGKLASCDPKTGMKISEPNMKVAKGRNIVFSYDIVYVPSDITWSTRWESYLTMPTSKDVHWFSIINSMMVLVFLSGMVAMIMLRTLRRDITAYNDLETPEEVAEETGWKLVHGDVFRPPRYASWLAVCVGTGTQILSMVVGTTVLAAMGFLSPANRGSLMTAGIFLFVFSGVFNGYASARLYKSFKMAQWKRTTTRAALAFPMIVSGVFLFLNFLVWGQRSSGAVPFWSLFTLMFLWFGVSVPLTFVGSFIGYRRDAVEDPVRTNKIPRQIPEQVWWNGWLTTVVVGGVLPFGAVFLELFFILTSLWQQQVYYLFGILAISFTIMAITCAELAIVLTYFQLTAENHRIWWRSFVAGGSCALYIFVYAMYYFFTRLEITDVVPAVMYVMYMWLASFAIFLMCGAIGLYSANLFVRTIYGSVKID